MSSGNSKQPRVTAAGPPEMGTSVFMPGDYPKERLKWLWPKRIPLGYLTLLAGEPQAGKSYLTLDIAARTSRGSLWPGESGDEQETGVKKLGPGSVLLVCAEDNWHDTICPRLVALSGDLSKICPLFFGEGLSSNMVLQLLQEKSRELNDCRLVVIDPISAFLDKLGGSNGTHGRRLVYLLAECILDQSIAMVMVTHLRRGKGKAMHRPSGSDALVRAARTVWLLENDRADPERRLLLPIKNNLAAPGTGLAFTLEPVGDGQYARLQWEDEPVPVSADDFLRDVPQQTPPRDHLLCETVNWLEELLRDGPQPAGEVQDVAKARGISYGTLRRAFCELNVQSKKVVRDGKSFQMWQLGPEPAAKLVLLPGNYPSHTDAELDRTRPMPGLLPVEI
jgi:hypothetical protein